VTPVSYTGGSTAGGGDGGGEPSISDAFSLGVRIADTNVVPTDVGTFLLRPSYAEANTTPTETAKVGVSGYSDSNVVPTDTRSAVATFVGNATSVPAATNWTNPANAQGAPDASNARLTDAVTDALSGTLVTAGIADAPSDLSTWTITKVEVIFYEQVSNTVAVDNNLKLEYSVSGAWQPTLATIVANENFLSAASGGRVFDVTASRTWTWILINSIEMRAVYAAGAIANTMTIDVNAFAVRVTATSSL
jgi:hypothetical protein